MSLVRLADWERRLERAVRDTALRPFQYGVHDHCLGAAALIAAMTGVDPVPAKLRGYKTAEGARRRLAAHGGVAGFARHVLDPYGVAEIAPAFAQRGDLVACAVTGDGETGASALGVVGLDGRWAFAARDPEGWSEIPARIWTHAWRIEWP